MSYTPLPLHLEVAHEYDASTIEDDAVSMLSGTAPYAPYRPPNITSELTTNISFTIECSPVLNSSTRLPTPPTLLPIIWPGVYPSRTSSLKTTPRTPSKAALETPLRASSGTSSKLPSRKLSREPSQTLSKEQPSQLPSRTPSKTPSQSLSLRLFNFNLSTINASAAPYSEALPWANSTHFRLASEGSQERAGLIDPSEPPLKQYFRRPRHLRQPRSNGPLRRFPSRGAGALFGVLLLTGSSLSLILAANNTKLDTWKPAQPSIYLSVFELLAILLTLSALTDGIAIAFWTRLVRGTTIAGVHDTYASYSPWAAVAGIFRLQVNNVGIASIAATCSLARGPLMQRALTLSSSSADLSAIPTFTTSTLFLFLASFLSILSVLAIVPLYSDYWILGRAVSLHPLEVARAFGAPLMDGVDGNAGARDIDIERGGLVVRYGVVERCGREKVLRVEDMSRVSVRVAREGDVLG